MKSLRDNVGNFTLPTSLCICPVEAGCLLDLGFSLLSFFLSFLLNICLFFTHHRPATPANHGTLSKAGFTYELIPHTCSYIDA
jgi:hypothetical protein